MANWNLLMGGPQPHEVAASVQQGFQMAQDRQRQQQEGSLRMEQRQSQARRQQEEDALAQLERHRDNIIKGARIVREINPRDEASWQQARAMAAQMGIPMDEVPATFDPAYVENLVKVADTFSPQGQGGQPPNIQREVDYYRGIGRDDLAQQLLENHAAGPPIVTDNGDGTRTITPRPVARQAAPRPAPGAIDVDEETGEQYRFRGGDHADPANWELIGGPGPGGPATFPASR